MMLIAMMLIAMLATTIPCVPVAQALPLDWLAGTWVQRDGETVVLETWTRPASGQLLGVGRTLKAGAQVTWEFLRIAPEGDRVVLFAQPQGRHPPTAFCLAKSGPRAAIFVNPVHDFPKQISYLRVGDDLVVEVSGGERRFTFEMKLAAPQP